MTSPEVQYTLVDVEDASEMFCGERFTLEQAKKLCSENGWTIDVVMSAIILVDRCEPEVRS